MPHLKRIVLRRDKYPVDGIYPYCLDVFQETESLVFDSPVTFFVGENGAGKSTLLRAISRRCGIHIWEDDRRSRVVRNPFQERLHLALDAEWSNGTVPGSYFASEIFRNFSQLLDVWAAADPGQLKYFGGETLMTMSHGESLMAFFEARYKLKGLYLMDEPETALSPETQLGLLKIMKEAAGSGQVQFIVATHSPILLSLPGADIYSFDSSPLRKIDYEETDHYRIYRDFMLNWKAFLEDL